MDKPATTSTEIHSLLAGRWSPIAFDPEFRLDDNQLRSLAEAARWAPSCFGAQPWSFIFCPRQDGDAWKEAEAALLPGNVAWTKNASLLIFAVGQHQFEHNGKDNDHHLYDTGAASMALVLQAEAMALRAHQMAGFSREKVIESFGVPQGWTPIAAIAAGKHADAAVLDDDGMRERERAPRERDELGSRFFAGKWGKALGS